MQSEPWRPRPTARCPCGSGSCHLQGLAPSATISIRREERLMSL